MNVFYGITLHGQAPGHLTDKDLITQIVTLARIWHFLYGNEAVKLDPHLMKSNYGDLLCDEKLQPLVDELHRRCGKGVEECTIFLETIEPALKKYGGPNVHSETCFINSVDKFISALNARAKVDTKLGNYYGRIILEPSDVQRQNGVAVMAASPNC